MDRSRRRVLLGFGGGLVLACAGVPRFGRVAPRVEWRSVVDGDERTAIVVLPEGREPPWPVVLFSHGHGQDAEVPIDRFGVGEACLDHGVVGIFPNTGGRFTEGAPDHSFFEALLHRAGAELPIDPARRYVAGFSGGAKRAYGFAATRSRLLAALFVHSGTIAHDDDRPEVWDPVAAGSAPLSVMHVHGARDEKVPPRGGTWVPPDGVPRRTTSMRAGLERWAEADGATFVRGAPAPEGVPPRCDAYEWRAPDGRTVHGLLDPELGHTWAPWAAGVMMRFFARAPAR